MHSQLVSLLLITACLLLACAHQPPPSNIRLSLYNPISSTDLFGYDLLTKPINIAELPFGTELAATITAHTVKFIIDGDITVTDDSAPFTLPLPKKSFNLEVIGYAESQQPIANTQLRITLSGKGLAQSTVKLSASETQEWLATHLDSVMKPKRFHAKNQLTMPYRLFVPEFYDPKIQYPLVVFLHGRGQRGQANEAKIYRDAALFTGPNSIVSPNAQQDFPSIILVPQCSDRSNTEEWANWIGNSAQEPFKGLGADGSYPQDLEPSASGAAALELIEYIAKKYSIDHDRIYLTGVSMGGFGTWELTSRRPDLFAAAVPMAGYSAPQTIDKIQHIPYWIFHGDLDEYNPVAGSRTMYKLLKERGAQVRYTELTGFTHVASFKQAWQNAAILPWLFAQKRPPRRK